MANTILYPAEERGSADYGWLKAKYSFSFANYYNPEQIRFGVLRVLNNDIIAPATGFDTHPHDNMEIITIPLDGDLEHKDSMGHTSIIKHGDVQVMSAGTGITHSEYNASSDKALELLQIWVFPDTKNVKPRYDQITLDLSKRQNQLQQILSPSAEDEDLWIHQNAWFSMGNFDQGKSIRYKIKSPKNGVYAFVISGSFNLDGHELKHRDALGIWNTEDFELKSSSENSEILLMDVPIVL